MTPRVAARGEIKIHIWTLLPCEIHNLLPVCLRLCRQKLVILFLGPYRAISAVCVTKGGVGAYKGGVHIAVVIRGGKVTLSTNNMGGRQLDLSTRRGFSEQIRVTRSVR